MRLTSFMKYLLAAGALIFAGCAGDQEDRAFFGGGWVNPEAGANARMGTTPRRPADM